MNVTGYTETNPEHRAALVLLKQFETVAYTRTAFLSSSDTLSPNEVDSAADLRLPFLELIGALKVLGPDASRDLETSYSAVLVGAKDFVGPKGLGAVTSRKCYVGILEGGAQPNVEPDFRQASHESIGGRQVWTWSTGPSEGASKPNEFYAAQISNSYFLMTNNREDFQEAANALASVQAFKPTLIGVPGWETFSKYGYWAHRSIHRNGAISSAAAGIHDLTPDLMTLTFFADVDRKESFLRVFSSDKSTETAPKVLPQSELKRLQPLGGGVWQAAIPLSKDEAGFDLLFEVFFRFGFGAAL